MKYLISILLFISVIISQDYNIYAGLGLGIHVTGSEVEDASYLDTFDDLKQEPSMADFFDPNFMNELGFSIGLFNSNNKDRRRGHFLVGFSYYQDRMESLFPNEDAVLLGNTLDIKTQVPYVGYAFYRGGRYKKGYYYLQAGPAFSTYTGKHKVDGVKQKTTYKENTGIFLGAGFLTRFTENLAMDIGTSYIIRDTKPLKVNRDDNTSDVIESSNALKDNTIKIKLGLMLTF